MWSSVDANSVVKGLDAKLDLKHNKKSEDKTWRPSGDLAGPLRTPFKTCGGGGILFFVFTEYIISTNKAYFGPDLQAAVQKIFEVIMYSI